MDVTGDYHFRIIIFTCNCIFAIVALHKKMYTIDFVVDKSLFFWTIMILYISVTSILLFLLNNQQSVMFHLYSSQYTRIHLYWCMQ